MSSVHVLWHDRVCRLYSGSCIEAEGIAVVSLVRVTASTFPHAGATVLWARVRAQGQYRL